MIFDRDGVDADGEKKVQMKEQKSIVYQKLVRDKIPEIIASSGKKAHVRRVRDQDLRDAIGRKILEEAFELFAEWQKNCRDDVLKESADLLEIVVKALSVYGFSIDDLMVKQKERAENRGAFDKDLFLDQVGGDRLLDIQTSKTPAMVFNPGQQAELIDIIRNELEQSASVRIASAFYSPGATNLIMAELTRFMASGGRLKVLLSTMGNITRPQYFTHFLENLPDAGLRVFHPPKIPLSQSPPNFHVKTWLFEHYDGQGAMIVGSSNLTQRGLTRNIEWNYYSPGEVNLLFDGKTSPLKSSVDEFERIWETETSPVNDDFLTAYRLRWKALEKQETKMEKGDSVFEAVADYQTSAVKITPNGAQQEALKNLMELRNQGVNKAAVVAATGIGKTYISAFDFKNSRCASLLYVAHREDILVKARQAFRGVLDDPEFGEIHGRGQTASEDGEGVFAMIQTLSRDNHLDSFLSRDFDYIVIDEFHHAGSASYEKILNHFKPKFLLGLTATPERMDGRNVLAYCGHNIAYEIRILEAVDRGWLAPFQYYAVYDETDYSQVAWRGTRYDEKELDAALENDTRTELIARNLKKFLPSSGKIKALAFCSSVSHARYTAEKLTRNHGLSALALWGESSDQERHGAIERLQQESDPLNLICTVDIFNEGTDIPGLSHVLFLRPTQSFTVFLQQLGRGLRQSENKDFLVVLDFIGNFKKAHVAPMALIGCTSIDQYPGPSSPSLSGRLKSCLPKGCFLSPDARVKRIWDAQIRKIVSNGLGPDERLKMIYQEIKQSLGKEDPLDLMDLVDNACDIDPCMFLRPRPFGSWLRAKDFCEDGNIFNQEKLYINTPAEDLLKHIETGLKPVKSYKMVVLLSLFELDGTAWPVEDIAEKFLSHYLRHPGQINDFEALARSVSPADFPLPKVRAHLKSMPLDKMSNADTDCFVLNKKDNIFSLKSEYVVFWNDPFFKSLVKERTEFSLARYFKRERLSQTFHFDPSVINSGLVLNRKFAEIFLQNSPLEPGKKRSLKLMIGDNSFNASLVRRTGENDYFISCSGGLNLVERLKEHLEYFPEGGRKKIILTADKNKLRMNMMI